MKKIPTLLLRDENDRQFVTDEVNPECQWVLDGEGIATRKFDGTCMKLDGLGTWWSRREFKDTVPITEEFILEQYDNNTGKLFGWVRAAQSSFVKFWREAVDNHQGRNFVTGTYELCGPKINGNPEKLNRHVLIKHGEAIFIMPVGGNSVSYLKARVLESFNAGGYEGIVWHHPDGRMAKLKARDLRKDFS